MGKVEWRITHTGRENLFWHIICRTVKGKNNTWKMFGKNGTTQIFFFLNKKVWNEWQNPKNAAYSLLQSMDLGQLCKCRLKSSGFSEIILLLYTHRGMTNTTGPCLAVPTLYASVHDHRINVSYTIHHFSGKKENHIITRLTCLL